jgi:hypothetical protein
MVCGTLPPGGLRISPQEEYFRLIYSVYISRLTLHTLSGKKRVVWVEEVLVCEVVIAQLLASNGFPSPPHIQFSLGFQIPNIGLL